MEWGAVAFERIFKFRSTDLAFHMVLRADPVPAVVPVRFPNNPGLTPVFEVDVNVARLRKHLPLLHVGNPLDLRKQSGNRRKSDVYVFNLECR